MSEHSYVVGGSNAQMRIACPGSLAAELGVWFEKVHELIGKDAFPSLKDALPVSEVVQIRRKNEAKLDPAAMLEIVRALAPKLPDLDAGSNYANEGRMLHEVMAICLNEDKRPNELVGNTYCGVVFTEELCATHAVPALDLFDSVYASLDDATFCEEIRVDLSELIPGAFGTFDVLVVGTKDGRRVGVIVDWKFGSGIVIEARGNFQMGFYALAATYDPRFREMLAGVDDFLFVIIQPTREPTLDMWLATERWMRMFEATLVIGIEDALKPGAPRAMGSWCRWCSAQLACPTFKNVVYETITKEPALMSSLELGWWKRKEPEVVSFFRRLDDYMKAQLSSGHEVPGYKMVAKRAQRRYIDEARVARIFSKLLPEDRLYLKSFVSPAQLEKAIKAAVADGSLKREQGQALIKKALPKLTEKPETGKVVAPISDKREAVAGIGPMMSGALEKLYARKEQAQEPEAGRAVRDPDGSEPA